ncbi:hypothetical protein ACWFNE_06730 [Cellulomonas sp. NPDC055163]
MDATTVDAPPVPADAPPLAGSRSAGAAAEEAPAGPRWGSLSKSDPARPDPLRPDGGRPDPVRATRPADELDDDLDEDDDEDDERPSHPYTWLQLLVLALVAFVLGFLIVLLGSRGSDDASGATPTPATASAVVGHTTTT